MKRPAFQFYPADWRKDAALQSCSIAARGLWHELMCVMHECEPYGHLVVNGIAMVDAQAARLVGVDAREYKSLLAELDAAGVPSRTDAGIIFSRRMTRDEAIRNARASGGQAGADFGILGAKDGIKGGRPTLVRGVIDPPLNPPPSSSSSSSEVQDLLSGRPDCVIDLNQKKRDDTRRQRGVAAVAILQFLNAKAGKNFGAAIRVNVDLVVARFAEGFTEVQMRQVIVMKTREWKDDPTMHRYLRPKTLFNRTNFANYVGELVDDEQAGPSVDPPPSAA